MPLLASLRTRYVLGSAILERASFKSSNSAGSAVFFLLFSLGFSLECECHFGPELQELVIIE